MGGSPIVGMYIVKAPEDGTDAPLVSAIERLSTLPQVASAEPDFFLSQSYEKPRDGAGWQRPQGEVEADSAAGDNWGMERIAAPLAWGCETGDSTVRVAIMDNGFHNVSDLATNTTNPGVAQFGAFTADHGTRVASIVGARGNNNAQITGVMWRADLQMYEYGTSNSNPNLQLTTLGLQTAMVTAAANGAAVINISSSLYWLQQHGRLPYGVPGGPAIPHPDSARADSARVRRVHADIRDAIAYADTIHGRRPLIVLSASNDGIDAWWSGMANVERMEVQTAYAPDGKPVLVLLGRRFTRWATVGTWYSPCDTGFWGSRCMDYTVTRGYRDVRIYSIRVAGGAPTLLWQENDINLIPMGVSAESNELAVTRQTSNSVTHEAWGKPSVQVSSTSTCRVQFRDLRQAGALRLEVPSCVDATFAP